LAQPRQHLPEELQKEIQVQVSGILPQSLAQNGKEE
jgi:hypothetical protein